MTAKWLLTSLNDQLNAIYRKDLLKEKIISKSLLKIPREEGIQKLRTAAALARKRHNENADAAKIKRRDAGWEAAARNQLFRWKRCDGLAKLLRIKLAFREAGFTSATKKK